MIISPTLSPDGKELKIKVRGRFDFSIQRAFRDSYAKVDPRQVRIIIDLSETEYMDSSALGMLLVLRERAGGDQAEITLAGCHDDIQQILEVSRFQELFEIK
jgi:anti-anti-sigma factor